ncbi:TPA: hypothetical protein ACXNIM_001771 [Stenotrophomonas maltophilia]
MNCIGVPGEAVPNSGNPVRHLPWRLDHRQPTADRTAFRYPVAEQNLPSRRLAESLGGIPVAREQNVKYTAIVYRIPAAASEVATGVAESG